MNIRKRSITYLLFHAVTSTTSVGHLCPLDEFLNYYQYNEAYLANLLAVDDAIEHRTHNKRDLNSFLDAAF